MALTLREVRDEDLPLLFEQWADPVAAQMAAFTAPDHMDRDAFERRWSRLRADETVLTRVIVVDDEVAGTIGSWGEPGEREVTYWMAAPTGAKGSQPMPSMRFWPLIGRGRSTPASRPTTSRPAASSRSAASASSRLNETSLKRAQPRSRNSCCASTRSLPRNSDPACVTGATGLEPATSGVTGRSWRFRPERGLAGICTVSRALRPFRCGDSRVRAGVAGSLVRDERGMGSCRCSKQNGCAPCARWFSLWATRRVSVSGAA